MGRHSASSRAKLYGQRVWLALVAFCLGVWLIIASYWLAGQGADGAPILAWFGVAVAGACFASAIYELTGE